MFTIDAMYAHRPVDLGLDNVDICTLAQFLYSLISLYTNGLEYYKYILPSNTPIASTVSPHASESISFLGISLYEAHMYVAM